jgi:hypothetical protein
LPPEPPPGGWGTDAEAARLVRELLAGATATATAATAQALTAAAAPDLSLHVGEQIERFGSYVRGLFDGGVVRAVLDGDLGGDLGGKGGRPDAWTLGKRLARHAPDPEPELFRPLVERLRDTFARARQALDDERLAARMRHLEHRETLDRPLDALQAALADLEQAP